MECFENGLLSKEDTGGIELRFGNDEAMVKVVELIARREGIGEMLAEGTVRLAEKIGKGASEFAVHVKGLDPGMHDPRIKPGFGLGYMVSPHGADHCTSMHDDRHFTPVQIQELRSLGILESVPVEDIGPRKVALFRLIHLKRILFDSLVACIFLPYSYQQTADLIAAVTGWDTSIAEQVQVAERIVTVARLFNVRQGLTADDDVLPARFFQPKTDGVLAGEPRLDRAEMDKSKSYFYDLMGWDKVTGIPTAEKLEELYIT
jgi:aldehyde:ferredoxin oxidoreductase